MAFHSYLFIFAFMPITLAVFYLLQKRGNARLLTGWLVMASLVFYGWWNPAYLLLIGVSVVTNFLIGQKIQARQQGGKPVRAFLIIGVVFNLALLAWFKYANFLADITAIELPHILLPLAISFFTFQQIAFLSDMAKGEIRENNFTDYCLFVIFFPQLIAGPVVRHKEIMPQFADKTVFGLNAQNLSIGVTFFVIGLFKKLVIADQIAVLSDPVFTMADQGGTIYFTEGWIAVLAYSMQIYFDFSAYSDMAVGLALMFGIQLPLNFFSPYKAANIIDFWRRWHITLSRFLRDYIYIALGGNKHGKIRRHANLLATMLIGGLWHGAGWNFLIWGGLHGFYLVINHSWQGLCRKRATHPFQGRIGHACAVFLTFMTVTITWVFFRAQNFDGSMAMLKGMTGINGISLPRHIPDAWQQTVTVMQQTGIPFQTIGVLPAANQSLSYALMLLIPALLITFIAPNTIQFMSRSLRPPVTRHYQQLNRHRPVSLLWQDNIIYAVAVGLMAVTAILFITRATPFLYFQF